MRRFVSTAVLVFCGCDHFAPPVPPPPPPPPPPVSCSAPAVTTSSPLRRLTRAEYDATLAALVGDTKHTALSFLPGEDFQPFDNAYANQTASAIYVEAAERLVAGSCR